MLSRRSDLRFLVLAIFVVLLGLFNSGIDEVPLSLNPRPSTTSLTEPLVTLGYHYRKHTREERFYRCFGEMAMGRQHERAFLLEHRGDLGDYQDGMVGPEFVADPVLPYRDYIAEYPPVNFPLIAGPSSIAEDSDTYAMVFRLMLAALSGAALLLSVHLVTHLLGENEALRRFLWLSLLGALLLGPIMVTRLDSIALVFFVGALVAVTKEQPIWAGVLLALATGAKIVPVFLVPLFLLHWLMKKELGKSLRFGAACLVSLLLIFLPPALIWTDNFRSLFRFHGERPVQVESTYAVLLRLQNLLFGTEVKLSHSYGSWNLEAAQAGLLGSVSTILALVLVALMLWVYRAWCLRAPGADKLTREWWLLRACAATVAGLMFFSKVFSPQYLIWVWPWIFLAEKPKRRSYHLLCLLVFFLTQLITEPFAGSVVHGSVFGVLLLATRNTCLLLFVVWLARFPGELGVREPNDGEDYGKKTALLPLGLVLTAFLVHHHSQKIEESWLADRPRPLSPLSYRLEFVGQHTHAPEPYRGYSQVELHQNNLSFVWTTEAEVVHFLPSRGTKDPHIFELRGLHALNPEFQMGLELVVNQQAVPIWESSQDWPRVYTAWIPPTLLKERGLNKFTLYTPSPISPKPEGDNPDPRKLGLQVDWLSLSAVEGFARFHSLPPDSVLEKFHQGNWVVRTFSEEKPSAQGWEQVGVSFWESDSSQELTRKENLVWYYRPGDFSADFARLPLGEGWSESGADEACRPTIFIEESGHLSLTLPQGPLSLSFTALKEKEGEEGPELRLSVNGSSVELERHEEPWQSVYRAELESVSGVAEFVFEYESGAKRPLGQITLAPK